MSLVTAKSPKAKTLKVKGVHEDKLCISTSLSPSYLHVRVSPFAPLHKLQLSRSANWADFVRGLGYDKIMIQSDSMIITDALKMNE